MPWPTCVSNGLSRQDGPVERNRIESSLFVQHVQSNDPPWMKCSWLFSWSAVYWTTWGVRNLKLPCACAICQCPMLTIWFLAMSRGKVARSPPQKTPGTLVHMYWQQTSTEVMLKEPEMTGSHKERVLLMEWSRMTLKAVINVSWADSCTVDYCLTLSTVTKFFESICILLPSRNSELGTMPGGRSKGRSQSGCVVELCSR